MISYIIICVSLLILFVSWNNDWKLGMFICNPNILLTIQFSSVTPSCPTLCDPMNHSTPGLPTPRVHPNSHAWSWWCHPAISSSVVPFFLSPVSPSIRVFSSESTLCIRWPKYWSFRWPKYWSFSFSIIPSKEHPGPISFRMDWLDLLAVLLTITLILYKMKSLLWRHCCWVSILAVDYLCMCLALLSGI